MFLAGHFPAANALAREEEDVTDIIS